MWWVSSIRRVALTLGTTLAVVALITLAAGRSGLLDQYFVYFPVKALAGTPGEYGMSYEEVALESADGTQLHGWFVPGGSDVTWLWFHGNGGNISHRLDNLRLLHDRLGVNVLMLDYRGYGKSQGKPSGQGIYMDAEAALSYLQSREDVDSGRIVYFGRSLGAAVAAELAARQVPYALVLESPLPSVEYMARRSRLSNCLGSQELRA